MQQSNGSSVAEIIGYVQPWITSPGSAVQVKVSSTEANYTHKLVRLLQGYEHCKAPPVTSEDVGQDTSGEHTNGRYQVAHAGSYGIVQSWSCVSWDIEESLEVRLYAQPYLLEHEGVQSLVSTLDIHRAQGFALVLVGGKLQAWIGNGTRVEVIPTITVLNRWRWHDIRISITQKRLVLHIKQLDRLAEPAPAPQLVTVELSSPVPAASLPLLLAAGMFSDPHHWSSKPASFFNGRLDSLTIAITGSQARALATFDFTLDMSSDKIMDVSGNDRHGTLMNAPTRAMKGHNWDGSVVDWTKGASHYGAIHFHEDDLDDANWETDFTLVIPPTCRSGVYAVELTTASGKKDLATFFVRPSDSSKAEVAFVAPTFTYLAYANEHMFDQTKSSSMAVPEGAPSHSESENFARLVRRSDLGLSVYDNHRDGSGCVYSSSKRPILNLRPNYIHWALNRPRELSADLMMIGLLEHLNIPYDVITDHCLHFHGPQIASRYTTLLTGSHPEYTSLAMLDAYATVAKTGGNIMYLGGNGFYWTTSTIATTSHRIEVRKGDQGCRSITVAAGERIHSSDGAQGGLWRSRGRAPNYLFGVGCCAFGTGLGKAFVRVEATRGHPICDVVFKGCRTKS